MTDGREQEIPEQHSDAVEETQKSTEQEILELREENGRLSDEKLRLLAEFDNYKKRSARDRQRDTESANAFLLEDIIPVLDDIERAVGESQESTDFTAFFDGIKRIHTKFIVTLEKVGVTVIDSGEGMRFDPCCHEAVFKEYSETHGSGTIISEVQRGYLFKGRLLRPSRVCVSEGPDPQRVQSTDFGGLTQQCEEDI